MVGCTCSQRDFRPTMLALVAEVRRLTGVRAECERQFQAQVGLVAAETTRAEAAEAEVVTLRAKVAAVEAVEDSWSRRTLPWPAWPHVHHWLRDLRAALATTGEGQ